MTTKKIETWFDKIKDKTEWENIDDLKVLIKDLPEGRYIVRIDKMYNNRSLEQNNSIWAIPYKYFERILTESGELHEPSKQQVHEWCMHCCLPEDYKERIKTEWKSIEPLIDIKTGELFKTPFRLTTTKMKTTDAMNYYENMQNFYAEFFSSGEEKDQIPDPDKNWKKKKSDS